METPWDRARKTKSQAQEERLGQLPGGKKGNNSGRIWRWKRDGTIRDFLIEARTTDANSYRVEYKEFKDIEREAMQTPPGLRPGMQVDIRDLKLMVVRESDWLDQYEENVQLRARLESLLEEE